MTTIHEADFPFEEVSRLSKNGDYDGDYAHSPHELRKLGYVESQIWSVMEGDEEFREDGQRISVYVYGPSGHYVNVIGYIATEEQHDGATYYEETMEMEPYPEDFNDE